MIKENSNSLTAYHRIALGLKNIIDYLSARI